MSMKKFFKRVYEGGMYALKRLFGWIKRAFSGGKKELVSGEAEIESPSRLLREAFFQRKTAAAALVTLVALFLFVFIAPLFISLDINYTDPLQQNVSPGYRLMKPPKALQREVDTIDGFADFTVGLSKSGEVFVWGNTKNRLQNFDLKKIPEIVKKEGGRAVAAGKDHILALTNGGKLVGWGDKSCGQYGGEKVLNAVEMPPALLQPIAIDEVSSLACGYQASALIFKDGTAYLWGNTNSVSNLLSMQNLDEVAEIRFTNSLAVALKKDGSVFVGNGHFGNAVSSKTGRQADFFNYIQDKKGVKIATDNKCVALLTADGELIVTGAFENGEDELPLLREGEYFTDLVGGTRHFVGVTNLGRSLAWGHDAYGQCELEKSAGEGGRAFAGSLQSYLVDKEGKLVEKAGLRGYLMGTDGRGRDVFARIAHGGKTTMTVGAVAVLVSTVIAVFVGSISGYFGGWVDTLLMRITEIFSSIPFLPFAMLLSQIIKNYNVSESMRIFIIMLILGALSWTGLARMIRGQVLAEREKEFVTAARAMGVKEWKIAFRHVLPNVVSVLLVSLTLDFAGCLLTESSLSYLGFGVQQPRPTWGNMLSGSNNSTIIQNYWWQWLFPALFLSLAVVCINVVGDALRDALDPSQS